MAKVEVVALGKRGKKKAGAVELDPIVFEAPVKPHLWQAEVRRQLAARRRGTHGTKNRSTVSGGGAKPWRQKGTGRARQGTTRAPQWEGGGAAFGPVPRSHEHALPKKARRAALCGALTQRLRDGGLTVVDELELGEIKTKRIVEVLSHLALEPGDPLLIVIDKANPNVERSARNLPWVKVLRTEGLNVYDVLRHPRLLVTRSAVAAIHTRLGRPTTEATA
jgi:large subunit ribosomal protein L4